jgi:hypothetical protein
MKRVLALAFAALPLSMAEPPRLPPGRPHIILAGVDSSGIRRATFAAIEKRFDQRLLNTPANDPSDLLGATRGVYVAGFGGVFTAEVSLVVTPTVNPFRQQITPEEKHKVWVRKVKALPVLREAMKEMVVSAGDALAMIPANEQVVLALRLLYLPWEKTETLPAQIIMRGERASLMRSGKAAIQVEEF